MDNSSHLCPVNVTQNVLMGKWKLSILWILHNKTRRFNELQRLMPSISRGVLTQQLRELEHDGLVNRKVYREVPPKVEYSLTEIGVSFIPVMSQIMEWGVGYIKKTSSCDIDVCLKNDFPCNKCHEMLKTD
ncbi:winged helix-turn-helix transcriptional regulator [Clostridium folliculivorans]|jgi:DNA-binding HxlR family transcriptional regulator|uniref:Transcriptional regulator n=1 Tax=Clostridium folliculivorans TaxID=2886038 RepID=A0A9W5Y6V4_9CLOT|nr:helix-turn-helix domain-containing protein [Clostridium folliculivorans]GKU27477.1 transcriptional regulator [Clostridium folliculivorans]GKU32327.1 transcriptional regulator [Clostridium folliculivorans]